MSDYSMDYSALETGWVTQGAADWCEAHGHAFLRVDGVDAGRCPRCLAVTEEPRYNGNGDRIFHGFTPDGEVFGIEVTDTPAAEDDACAGCGSTEGHGRYDCEPEGVYVSDEGDQGYGEWLESIEEGVSATLRATWMTAPGERQATPKPMNASEWVAMDYAADADDSMTDDAYAEYLAALPRTQGREL